MSLLLLCFLDLYMFSVRAELLKHIGIQINRCNILLMPDYNTALVPLRWFGDTRNKIKMDLGLNDFAIILRKKKL